MALRGTSNSRPSSSFNRFSLVLEFTLLILIYTANISHGADIISVTRLPNQGDSFDVKSHGLICSANTCTKYNANQKHSGISDSCSCQCSFPSSTFYSKTRTCMNSQGLFYDNGCSIQFKDKSLASLPVLDILSSPGTLRLDNNMSESCSRIKTTWLYFKNNTWNQGKKGIFSVTLKQHWTKPNLNKWFLKWSSGLHGNSTGLIIKVIVSCEQVFDTHEQGCLMFKTQGTHKVMTNTNPLKTTKRPHLSSTAAVPKTSHTTTLKTKTESSTGSNPTHQQVSPTATTPATTIIPKKPNKVTSTGDQRLWIAFAAGGVTVFIVLLACLVFFFFMCRQKKRQHKRREITRNVSSRTDDINDPLHDYEYVVYPVLTDGYQGSSADSLDNAMYGRGPDNELIIRTPGVSMESLATNSINQIRDSHHGNTKSSSAFYSRDRTVPNHVVNLSHTLGNTPHEYAQLQGKDEVKDDISGIYQPLIRPVTPDTNNDRPDENQSICLELIDSSTSNGPDYMVLEPTDPTTSI